MSVLFDTTNTNRVCVNIPIIEDILYEGDEQFLVTFGNLPSAQAGVGRIGQACVTIVEDDSQFSTPCQLASCMYWWALCPIFVKVC